jgi:ribonuclease Z
MTLLGVGTAVPDQDRENTHMVWEAPDGLLLIDAGGSTYQRLLRANLDPLKLRGIFLTHSHADHINGLAALLFQLALVGYQGACGSTVTRRHSIWRGVSSKQFELESHQAQVEWVVVAGGDEVPLNAEGYRLRVADTVHSRPCLALRFEERASGKGAGLLGRYRAVPYGTGAGHRRGGADSRRRPRPSHSRATPRHAKPAQWLPAAGVRGWCWYTSAQNGP